MGNTMHQLMINAAALHLQAHGWTPGNGTAIASKTYQTAVGPKCAHAYLVDFGANAESRILTGDYQSEGRNCLSTTFVFIPKTVGVNDLPSLVAKFAAEVDAAVADTYAMRLAA